MSLPASSDSPIPEETFRVAHAAFPKGNVFMRMRDALGPIYSNLQFARLFSHTGQPAEAPARLALVLVMQFAEGLADRQAADAVRSRIDWKYALGLELTDPGFDYSVLSEFRMRLIVGGVEHLLLETMLTYLQERGLLKGRGTQRTDSTHILTAIRTLNRLELVGETMRFALNRLAAVAPTRVQTHLQPGWLERYGARVENYRLPRTEAARQRLAGTIGADGFALLQAVYAPETPPEVRTEPAVEVLRRIWVQQYYGPDDPPRWRHDGDVPPSSRLIHSPYDLEARYSLKRGMAWIGYKVHVTETCDDDTPHVITHVETTPATTPDDKMLDTIHAALAEHARLPQEPTLSSGSMRNNRLSSTDDLATARWFSGGAPHGIDPCRTLGSLRRDRGGDQRFRPHSSDQCPSRARCTRSHHTRRSHSWDDSEWPRVWQPTVVLDPPVFC